MAKGAMEGRIRWVVRIIGEAAELTHVEQETGRSDLLDGEDSLGLHGADLLLGLLGRRNYTRGREILSVSIFSRERQVVTKDIHPPNILASGSGVVGYGR